MARTTQGQTREEARTSGRPMPQRYFLIDGLRTICALIIVMLHYRDFFFNPAMEAAGFSIDTPKELNLFPFVGAIKEYGPWMVQVFWMISGFIFAHVYGTRQNISARGYVVNRFSRLYPLHFATLLYIGVLHLVAMAVFGHQIETGSRPDRTPG